MEMYISTLWSFHIIIFLWRKFLGSRINSTRELKTVIVEAHGSIAEDSAEGRTSLVGS